MSLYILNVPGICSARRLDPKIKGDVSIDIFGATRPLLRSTPTRRLKKIFIIIDVPAWCGGASSAVRLHDVHTQDLYTFIFMFGGIEKKNCVFWGILYRRR